jgi:hypothetical protein
MSRALRAVIVALACVAGCVLAVPTVGHAAASPTVVAITFGGSGWIPLTGDWNGSGTTQIGAYDPSNNTFYLGDSAGVPQQTITFGGTGWIPLAGDWNGSGTTQIGAYDPSNNTFYLGDSAGVAQQTIVFGGTGWTPLVGDWNGFGTTQIGAYDGSNTTFYLGDAGGGVAQQSIVFGGSGWTPLAGDWNGSGKTQIGAYDPSDETFYLGDSGGAAEQTIQFGASGDVPITGDWNGSGTTQIGVYDPSNDTFYLRETTPTTASITPGTSAPVATVPVTTVLPAAPAQNKGHHGRVHVRIAATWTWLHDRTRLHQLQIGRLPAAGKFTIRCSGRGCGLHHALTAKNQAGVRRLERRLAGTVYSAGDRIVIEITAPGRVTQHGVIRILANHDPVGRATG